MNRPTDHELLMASVEAMQTNLANIYATLKDMAELIRDLIEEIHRTGRNT
jgi:hypothetical protein